MNVYETEAGKDAQGNAYESKTKVQILSEGNRAELIDVKVDDVSAFKDAIGEMIEIAVKPSAGKSPIYYRQVV